MNYICNSKNTILLYILTKSRLPTRIENQFFAINKTSVDGRFAVDIIYGDCKGYL